MIYKITAEITSARGVQTYTVEANSEAEARDKHEAGDSEFQDEHIEVMNTEIAEIKPSDL